MLRTLVCGIFTFTFLANAHAATGFLIEDSSPLPLQLLIQNANALTFKKPAPSGEFGKDFASYLSASLMSQFSPSGDPVYTKTRVFSSCTANHPDAALQVCTVSVVSETYRYIEAPHGQSHEEAMDGQFSTLYRFQVASTKDSLGKVTRSIVGNAVRVLQAD